MHHVIWTVNMEVKKMIGMLTIVSENRKQNEIKNIWKKNSITP